MRERGKTDGVNGGLYIFRHVDEDEENSTFEEVATMLLRVRTRLYSPEMDTHENVYFMTREEFNEYLDTYHQLAEQIMEVEEVSIEEMEDELDEYEYAEPLH